MIDVSVIIVNFNGRHLLRECMESLKNQKQENIEIILVDNGSTDDSVEYIKKNHSYVKIIELDKNYGFAKANNIGIESTKAEKIALLNNDAVADPMWLYEMNNAMNAYKDVGICGSRILNYWNNSLIDAAGDLLGVAESYKRGFNKKDSSKYRKKEYIFGASACAVLYRRNMLSEIGFFDEQFVTNLEDVDLSYRAQLMGYKCLYVPEAIVYHKIGETKKKIKWSGRYTFRNNKIFWIKNTPLRILMRFLPRLLFDDIKLYSSALIRSFTRKEGGKIKFILILTLAYSEVILMLPGILKKRRKIQRNRKVSKKYIQSLITIKGE